MRHALALSLLLLVGCGVNPYLKFDSQEYQNFIVVKATADQARPHCRGEKAIIDVYARLTLPHASAVAQEYVTYRGTRETVVASQELAGLVEEFKAASVRGMSPTYCERKLDNISDAAEKIAVTLAKKE